jgi:hypothetical protein
VLIEDVLPDTVDVKLSIRIPRALSAAIRAVASESIMTAADPPLDNTRLSMRVPNASSAVALADTSELIAELLVPTVAVRLVILEANAESAVVLAVVSAVTNA